VSARRYEWHRHQPLTAIVLSALLLRALIPAGFMPMSGAGGLSLGFCPGAGAMPPGLSGEASPALQSTHGHAHHAGGAGSDPGRAHHYPCLFSIGATTTFAAAPTSPALIAPALKTLVGGFATVVFLPAILRAQSPRGPPNLV
jgi:hypothetical protein